MPISDMVILGLIVAAFVAFAGTLAWASRSGMPAAQAPAKRPEWPSQSTARHA
jgi:hypothetical protein